MWPASGANRRRRENPGRFALRICAQIPGFEPLYESYTEFQDPGSHGSRQAVQKRSKRRFGVGLCVFRGTLSFSSMNDELY